MRAAEQGRPSTGVKLSRLAPEQNHHHHHHHHHHGEEEGDDDNDKHSDDDNDERTFLYWPVLLRRKPLCHLYITCTSVDDDVYDDDDYHLHKC